MSAPFKETTWAEKWIPRIFFAGIFILFIITGLVFRPNGYELLWDKLHPFGVADGIGCAMFSFGCIWLAGWLKPVYNPANSVMWNIICGALLVLGVVIFWNL